jgi:3-hydroxybutyryl-CoA dehydrogenase
VGLDSKKIVVIGIGRMGKGISLAFAYAGYVVSLIDSEERPQVEFEELQNQSNSELVAELAFLQEIDVISAEQIALISDRISIINKNDAQQELAQADFVFEAVLEVIEIKQGVYGWLNDHVNDNTIISSSTSTMSANDLAEFVQKKERFVNAHWLNPAHLMPLVEVSPGDNTSPAVVESMKSLLEGIGKVPVVCKASPGFIVSRIQAVAMNEATRVVEEGVASAEDVDKAIKAGFGIRYATLGLIEFIDWGGGDILYHATNYLSKNLDEHRFSVSDIVKDNMANNRNGLRDGIGFYDWQNQDVDAYRRGKLTEFVRLLEHRELMPKQDVVDNS